MKTLVLSALRFYKARVSPHLPPACRYTPTCSEYAMEADRAARRAARRLARDAPRGGVQSVQPRRV